MEEQQKKGEEKRKRKRKTQEVHQMWGGWEKEIISFFSTSRASVPVFSDASFFFLGEGGFCFSGKLLFFFLRGEQGSRLLEDD